MLVPGGMDMDGWTPGRRISTLYRRCQRHLDRRFEAEGIPAGHGLYLYLVELSRGDGVTQVELAQRLALDPASVTRSLKRLEEQGWVERHPGEDGRQRRVSLTPGGRAMLPRIRGILEEWNNLATRGFSREERTRLEALLGRMGANLEEGFG